MFRSLLVANRGEIALRVIRAARSLGIRTVAVYSDADRDSPHLDEADARFAIGGPRAAESYLDMDAILAAAEATRCQAIHPGYGFLAENARFAARCAQQKIAFVGPPPGAIRLMGDKATARRAMKAAGLPTIPGSEGVLGDAAAAREAAARIGYPVLLKATAGGGGKGMRIVRGERDLDAAYAEASLEAGKAFGNAGLYMEKYIESGRHIEFQVLADAFGHAIHLGERECSVQRNHQKLVEESPSPALDDAMRAEIGARVARAAVSTGYVNAGTMEFLMDEGGRLYFMEMNTRIQVEHPVTEMVTGIDLVKQQLAVAANVPLAFGQQDVAWRGHAIEVRLNAEDPAENFRPDPGTIRAFRAPEGAVMGPDAIPGPEGAGAAGAAAGGGAPGGAIIRLDTHVAAGYRIPPFYDSMVGKLIAHAATRDEARAALRRALDTMTLEGIRTTIPLHREILVDPEFAGGRYDTGFMARFAEKKVTRG